MANPNALVRPNAGTFEHMVDVEVNTPTNADDGTVRDSWASVGTRWASIEPLGGTEVLMAQQLNSVADHIIRFWHLSGITRKHRITFGSRTFNIVSVKNVAEQDIVDEVLVKEDV